MLVQGRWPSVTLRVFCWLLAGLCLMSVPVHAELIDFGADAGGTALTDRLEIQRDVIPSWPVSVAAALPFRPVAAEDLRAFYAREALWLRISLRNPEARAQTRLLEISPPRLEDVRLFMPVGRGQWQQMSAGAVVPMSARIVQSRLSVFPVTLAAGETRTLLVRIHSRNSIMLNVRLWTENGLHAAERRIDLVNGIEFGALGLFVVYALVFFLSTRDADFLLFGLLVAACLLNDLSLFQYSHVYLWPQALEWNLRSPGILGTPTIVLGTWLLMRLLKLRSHAPVCAYLLIGWMGLMVLLMPMMAVGDYIFWVNVQQALGLAMVLVQVAMTLAAAIYGVPYGWLLLLSFTPMWLVAILRLAQVVGLIPPQLAVDYSQYWTLLFSGVLLVAIMNNLLRGQREHASRAAFEARLEAEQQLKLHTRELRMAKELAEANSRAKSAFLAQLSHELRTPLHSILGYSGLVLAETPSTRDRRRMEAVQQSGRHLLALIDELLDYARLEANRLVLEPRPVYLHALLDSVLQEVRQQAPADMSITVEAAAGLPPTLRLDPVRLRQVLLNLMINACRHSQASTLCLQVERQSDGRILFAVVDNGIGIPPAERSRIFLPFEQGATPREGMGLGLAICDQFVHLMGGSLVCEEAPGGGTLFRFSLQLEEAPESQVQPLAGEIMPRRYIGPLRQVLVVDDIAENRALLADVLASLGFAVLLADSGATALSLLALQPVDLVITDQLMPQMSGWELLRQAREQSHDMPFILLSGAAPVLPDQWPAHLVFAVILMKPAEPSRLAEAIASALRLEWESDTDRVMPGPLAVPPADERRRLHEAVAEGRISDIEDWLAPYLVEDHPCRSFALAVQEAALRLDMVTLQRLAESS